MLESSSHRIPCCLDAHEHTDANGVVIGGFAVGDDGRSAAVVAAEDNLLKGAATQAVQNINLALGVDELTGI